MTDITAFPTATKRILVHGDNSYTFTAAETIKAGQLVSINSTGGDFTVYPANSGDSVLPIGVADANAATSGTLTVHLYGTVAKVFNIDDTTAIEAGTALESTTVDGCVQAAGGGGTEYVVGIALEDIPATSSSDYGGGNMLICPHANMIA